VDNGYRMYRSLGSHFTSASYLRGGIHEYSVDRTTSEVALLRKELTEARELLRVRKERRKGKCVAVKGKFVFNTKEILELIEEAKAEASKGKSIERRITRTMTSEIEDEEEESIENGIYESESDCIIVASSRSK
jgi:hypothetical protein